MPWRFARDQVADGCVVEELDVRPRDAFTNILILFLLQSQLDEDLLQLLVAVVDDKLLKAVVLKDLKAVNVKDTNGPPLHALALHGNR